MKRSTGVTILAVVTIIYGIFSLLLAFLGVVGMGLVASGFAAGTARAARYSTGTLAYAAIWDAVLGILYLVFGIGAFTLKGWAWTVGVVVLVLDVVRTIVGYFISGFAPISIITAVIALLLIWYLFTPNVRAAFGKAAQPSHP